VANLVEIAGDVLSLRLDYGDQRQGHSGRGLNVTLAASNARSHGEQRGCESEMIFEVGFPRTFLVFHLPSSPSAAKAADEK
jgi:hypothetical protein